VGNSKQKAIGKRIQEKTSKKDRIYYLGNSSNAILSYADRLPASPYFNSMFVKDTTIEKQVVKDLQASPPKIIVKDKKRTQYPMIQNFIDSHYIRFDEFERYNLYKHRENSGKRPHSFLRF